VWAPQGANLLVNQSSPLLGMLLAPLTWVWGPVAATNTALTLAPALSSWGCLLACKRFVTWRWAPWLGGLLYGYSPFVFASVRQGHLGLATLVVPPLIVVVLDNLLRTRRGPAWSWGLLLGLLVVAQFLISPEVLLMTVVAVAIGLVVLGLLTARSWSARGVRYAVGGVGTAFGVVAVLLALPLSFAFTGPRHINGSVWPGLNLFGNSLNDFFDVDSSASASHAGGFAPVAHSSASLGLTGPNPAYLGVGVLVVVALSVAVAWRRKITWALLAAAAASGVISLGVAGLRSDALRSLSWLPWQTLVKWPLLDDVLPGRFSVLTDLALAIIVAIGLDETKTWLSKHTARPPATSAGRHGSMVAGPGWLMSLAPALVLIVVGAAALVPVWRLYGVPTSTERVEVPPWFANSAPSVPAGSVVLTYPFPASASLASEPMIWQAVDGMHFRLAGGYLKVPGANGHPLTTGPPGSATESLVTLTLLKQTSAGPWLPSPARLANIRSALSRWNVSYVVVTATGPNPVYTAGVMTAVTGRLPQVTDRAWVWNLGKTPLGQAFDPSAAYSQLQRCVSSTALYEDVVPHRPLPSTATRCVAGTH
jgi:hypothetical protein